MANTLIYACLGGILPALLWLWFWLREDRKHPEPTGRIAKTFLLGMLAVIIVLPIQKGVELLFPGLTLIAIILWAFFEEILKFAAGWFGGLHTKDDNEPIDGIIYMITAALGFVALENTLFILGPLIGENVPASIVMGNLRFIGASLLHVVASGVIGVSFAFSYYCSHLERKRAVWKSLLVAVFIHTLFNYLILNFGPQGNMLAFLSVWLGVVWLLWAFEKAKSIARTSI